MDKEKFENAVRPILFSGEMVSAILNGRKTVTRRVVNPQPTGGWSFTGAHGFIVSEHPMAGRFGAFVRRTVDGFREDNIVPSPYGQPGDVLWVRDSSLYVSDCGQWLCRKTGQRGIGYEVFSRDGSLHFIEDDRIETESDWHRGVLSLPFTVVSWSSTNYRQKKGSFTLGFDENDTSKEISMCKRVHLKRHESVFRRKIPSIHMPRWASRIQLRVVNVRVERLQDITTEQIRKEGVDDGCTNPKMGVRHDNSMRLAFKKLWDGINGKREGCGWDDNPWVWVVEFERVAAAGTKPRRHENGETMNGGVKHV